MPKLALLLALALLTGCAAKLPNGQPPGTPPAATAGFSFSIAEFSFSYPATWSLRPGDGEDVVALLARSSGYGRLLIQKYHGEGSLLAMQRYEESQVEGPLGKSEEATLGGLPSFRVHSDAQLDGRQVIQVSSGALYNGRGYYAGYVYDPTDPAMGEVVGEIEGILASWVWN